MKTSKKILIGIAGFLIIALVGTLLVLKQDMKTIMANASVLVYKEIPVETFDHLNISANWNVRIKQGKNHKFEMGTTEGDSIQHSLTNENGTLHLIVEGTPENPTTGMVHARITAPNLHTIRAEGNAHVEMKTFWSDSILVILEDSSTYVGNNLDYKQIRFASSGNDR